MKFKTGHKVIHNEETKRKIGEANRNRIWRQESRDKIKLSRKLLSEETKYKLGNGNRGKKFSKEVRDKISRGHIGISHKLSQETKKKISIANGSKKGWITPINTRIRNSTEYKLWRKAVFERDSFTCVWCFKKDRTIQADHIKPFAFFPELRFAIDNGRTLCQDCHKLTATYGNKKYDL